MQQLKHWVVLGYNIRCDCVEIVGPLHAMDEGGPACRARQVHMAVKPRTLTEQVPAALLGRLVVERHFEEAELTFLR